MELSNHLLVSWAELQKYALQIKGRFAPFIAMDIEGLLYRLRKFRLEGASASPLLLPSSPPPALFPDVFCVCRDARAGIHTLRMCSRMHNNDIAHDLFRAFVNLCGCEPGSIAFAYTRVWQLHFLMLFWVHEASSLECTCGVCKHSGYAMTFTFMLERACGAAFAAMCMHAHAGTH